MKSFNHCSVKQIKQFLRDFKNHHTIKNYNKMKKDTLIGHMDNLCKELCLMDGGSKASGYVQRLQAENKIIFDKINNPSKYMIDRYGTIYEEQRDRPEPQYEEERPMPIPMPVASLPRQLFQPDEVTDFNVRREKPKKKRLTIRAPTETEEDRDKQRKSEEQRKEVERRSKLVELYDSLKTQSVDLKDKIAREKETYDKVYKALQSKKGISLKKKYEIENQNFQIYQSKLKTIKEGYPELLKYIKENKLNVEDLNSVYRNVRIRMDKL